MDIFLLKTLGIKNKTLTVLKANESSLNESVIVHLVEYWQWPFAVGQLNLSA